MKANVININMDRECDICGKKGAGDSGICLECAGKRAVENMKARISPDLYMLISNRVAKLLSTYDLEINAAYLRSPDLTIAFSVKIQESKIPGKLAVDTKISFVESKIQDSAVDLVNDGRQGDLFK